MLFVVYNYNFITKFFLILSVFIFFRLLREPIISNNLNTDKKNMGVKIVLGISKFLKP